MPKRYAATFRETVKMPRASNPVEVSQEWYVQLEAGLVRGGF